ncbi:MAG: nitroreductase family deazaflavin-dependent oxidoreductase [Candidatus Limnocylindrales bacterium]
MGEELADWGKVALLETIGRVSGRAVSAAIGFIEEPGGALVVAAGSESSDWALNLGANARCRATIGERAVAFEAREIDGPERAAAVTNLILKYGTPAERLGHGPVFRLVPIASGA